MLPFPHTHDEHRRSETRDFGVGRCLHTLREIGFNANPSLLEIQQTSVDCHIGQQAFHRRCFSEDELFEPNRPGPANRGLRAVVRCGGRGGTR